MSVAGGFEMLVCYLVCSYQRLSHHTLVTVHVESTYLLAWCQLRTSANPAAVPYTDLSLARQRPTSLFLVGLCRQAEIDTTAVLLRYPQSFPAISHSRCVRRPHVHADPTHLSAWCWDVGRRDSVTAETSRKRTNPTGAAKAIACWVIF